MTVEHKKEVRIPTWLFTMLVPIIIAIIGYAIGISTINAQSSTKIEYIQEECMRLDAQKANKETVTHIQNSLNRIENKLDRYIARGD